MYLYHNMLNPDLYNDEFVANFVDSLLESEIEAASDENVSSLKKDMMATDDIESLAEPLMEAAQDRIRATGTLSPHFITFPEKESRVRFELEEAIPTKHGHIKQFLSAGKALGMIRSSQCTFFSTLQPLINDQPALGNDVAETCPWGVIIIGSSLRGNCFVHLQKMNRGTGGLYFQLLRQDILREGKYSYPFSKFFHIEDENEMNEVITQIPKLKSRSNLSDYDCLVNFATTLKALRYFGYDH